MREAPGLIHSEKSRGAHWLQAGELPQVSTYAITNYSKLQHPNDSKYDSIRQVLGRSGEIMIAAPLDRCLGFIAMAKEMTEKKAAAARKVC